MTTDPAATADRGTIARKILDIAAETARDHALHGEKGTDLRDAPKHLLCVDVARGLARAFGSLRYHLQAAPDEPPPSSRNDVAATAVDKALASFDIVLLDGDSGAPRHVVEIEHGTKIIDDVHRAMRAVAPESGREHGRHAFLVTILRRSEAQAGRIAEKLLAEIEDPSTRQNAGLAANAPLTVTHSMQRIGESRSHGKDGTAIYAVVFELSIGCDATGASTGAVD